MFSCKRISSLALSIAALFVLSVSAFAANTITGVVYDNRGNPLIDCDLELLNELGAYLQHQRTDSTGRYTFSGLADGRYSVRVIPLRYDFEESVREVYFSTFSVTGGTGSDAQIIDFSLTPRKNGLAYAEAQVIFAQEVPDAAKTAFKAAEAALKKRNTDAAIKSLEEAIKIFPNYFAALFELGEIYTLKQDYGKAANYLVKAADINNKSPKSFYYLGVSLSALKLYPAAIVSLNQALTLSPASTEVLLILGSVEILAGKFDDAEKHLKQVKKLAREPNPDVYWQLSQLYGIHLKRYNEAADELEAYIKSLPDANSPEQKSKIENYRKIVKQMRDKAAGK